ncbi:MAG: indolepyruvate ferredoxin oxidoreductase family protein, partial [Vulcanimicrobiaceae bacterium]
MALDDRYTASDGVVYLSGNQALVRLLLEQRRRDERAGIRTGIFVTGYPGSPLGGFDLALGRARAHAQAAGVVHLPGQNEELAATTLMGTQMIDDHPHPDVDGVVGYWYGKGPGLDRATDALKHGNFAGTSRTGAVVILSGEDHEAKSSTVPYEQEAWFEHTGIPLLYPSSVAQFIEFGLHAAALSRYSGCYVGMKLVGALCDGGETVRLSATTPQIRTPELAIGGRPFRKRTNFMFSPGLNLETEKELYGERHVAVRAYARLNALDRIEVRTAADRVGIVASGKSFVDVRQALRDLGLDDDALNVRGIRLMRVGMLYPADGDRIREFGAGLDEVIVVEEKRDFLERQVGRALRDLPERVRIIGKTDDRGAPAFPMYGGFDGDLVAEVLASRLARRFELPAAAATRLAALRTIRDRSDAPTHRRSPNYCSGCPHNVSTKLLPDQIAWGAPGCHIFASMMEQPERRIEAVTQYGGEGLPWLGLAPFVTRRHIVQNVGDGSLFHSSYLNIRFAVHAGANITFKILYNGAIANTGGQVPAGALPVEKLVTLLATEGVARIDVIAVEPRAYAGVPLPRSVRVRPVAELARSLAELEQTGGVTVQLYDGTCSNERRRRQKRGTAPAPAEFVVINEDVCENCGDCGALTNCMSLQKVETEFGPKTQVHQSSCNQDRSCLGGDCPSFVSVRTKPGSGIRRPAPARIDATIPEPVPSARLDEPYHISIPGVGGTGVITLNAILAQAAALDGHRVSTYDQTGAAQKWGQVLSNVIVAEADGIIESNRTGLGRADLYLALDLMAAAD